jgi:hypothetical protein
MDIGSSFAHLGLGYKKTKRYFCNLSFLKENAIYLPSHPIVFVR